MSFNPLEYKGNAIFRNQPNHTYFDKSFGEDPDPLFFLLNDIDPYFWHPEQKAKKFIESGVTVIDPRTQKCITQLEYDHTKDKICKLFQSPKRSIITEKQHKMCIQALNCMQHNQTAGEEEMYNWHSTRNARQKEKEHFQKFVAKFCQTNSDYIYAPCRKLLELYQKWYKFRSKTLVTKYPQESYNTHLGLPHVRLCKNALKDVQVEICNPEVVAHLGTQNRWQTDSCLEIKKLKQCLDSYLELYINSEDKQDVIEKEMHDIFVKKIDEEELSENTSLYMPLESLLFLLTAGDYIDIPMEMLLNIKHINNKENDNQKVIIMDLPLPSRQAGWHSYQQVVEQAVLAVLSISEIKRNTNLNKEIEAHRANNSADIYKIFTLEDYMQNCKASPDQLCQFSKTLIKWQLKPIEEDSHFNIYTSVATSSVKDGDTENLFSMKLEYKPHLGCEIMTKYQLLKEWLQLKLLPKTKTTCFRLDINNYQTILQEQLTVQKLEEYLSNIYNTNCQQLMANMFEFLKMLYNMPCDHYMLRFNPKFKDKLMLCKPSKEIAQNTIHLHQLLSDCNISDILFMSQQSFLPIDDNLCSLMHLQHNIIPCAFSPLAVGVSKVTPPKKFNKKPLSEGTQMRQQSKTRKNNLKRNRKRKRSCEDKQDKAKKKKLIGQET